MARAATLAFHEHRMDAVGSLERGEDWLLDLQASFAAGDSVSLRAGLAEVRDLRAGLPSSSVTLDALLSEAELLVGMGRIREAADALDPALRALPQAVPLILTDPVWAAALVRVACLRSVIAFRLDDLDTTNRWLGAVRILWSDADPFLLERMSELDSLLE